MAKKPNRLPKDFDQNKVSDVEITDPDLAARLAGGELVDREYPKHVHKYAGPNQMHEYIVVNSADEEAQAKRDGYGPAHDAEARAGKAPKAAEAAKAPKKARAPKKAAKKAKAKKAPAADKAAE